MRKRPTLRTWVAASALAATCTGAQAVCGSETPLPLSSKLASSSQRIVSSTDAKDEAILAATLHSNAQLEAAQWVAMIAAAERRYQRQIQLTASLSGSMDLTVDELYRELESRRRDLELAHVRRVIEMQRVVRRNRADLARAVASVRWEKPMRKFEGTGKFRAADLTPLSKDFEQEFHRPLPITARGETRTHLRLGLDHRGRFDIGLSPETPEGIWLRRTLEAKEIPYIAFRRAVRGAATAPHIHIGTASSRIPRDQRGAFRLAYYKQHRVHRYRGYGSVVMARHNAKQPTGYHMARHRRVKPFNSTETTAVAVAAKPQATTNVVLTLIAPISGPRR